MSFSGSFDATFCNQPMTCKFATTFPLREVLSKLEGLFREFSTLDAADSLPTQSAEGACLCSKVMMTGRGFNHSVTCRLLTSESFVVSKVYG